MLIFDGLDFQTRIIKLRQRQTETCVMCSKCGVGEERAREILDSFDYKQFCGAENYNDKSVDVKLLNNETQRVSCSQYFELSQQQDHLLIDVRPQCQFKICSLPKSISITTKPPNDKFFMILNHRHPI